MIKEWFISFKDSIKTKTTNPFLGTLIIVWVIHNWELLYTLFNFNPGTSLDEKTAFIWTYLNPKIFFIDLACCVGIAFLVLIATYLLLNSSRFITNLFENIVTPWVYKITAPKKIVLLTDLKKIENERDDFENKYTKERENRIRLQNEYEKLEEQKVENKPNDTEDPLRILPESVKEDTEEVKRINLLYRNIKEKGFTFEFKRVIEQIAKNATIDINVNALNYFLQNDILIRNTNVSGYYFLFTDFGHKFKKHFTLACLEE